ncbi:MAG: AAA family ATPase [Candidatus Omnitrophota bacterium]
MIKVAFAGKGGVGKSTIASLFIKALEKDGMRVLAVDCDPVANLGRFLGIKDADKIIPIVEMKELINERTEASKDRAFYKLNPKVDDIPERFAKKIGNIKLIVMGTPSRGGSGCMCPEASFMKALLGKLLLQEDESVVLDMEAGVEHLGRGTASFVDHLFIVVEPNLNSIDAAKKIWKLAKDLKIKEISVIANKVRNNKDLDFVKENIAEIPITGSVSFEEKLLELDIDIEKTSVYKQVAEIEKEFLNT